MAVVIFRDDNSGKVIFNGVETEKMWRKYFPKGRE